MIRRPPRHLRLPATSLLQHTAFFCPEYRCFDAPHHRYAATRKSLLLFSSSRSIRWRACALCHAPRPVDAHYFFSDADPMPYASECAPPRSIRAFFAAAAPYATHESLAIRSYTFAFRRTRVAPPPLKNRLLLLHFRHAQASTAAHMPFACCSFYRCASSTAHYSSVERQRQTVPPKAQ